MLSFSCSVMSNSLQPHEQQHARLPCPSPSSWACSNSCSEWLLPSKHLILCHPLLFMPSIFPNMRVFSNDLSFLDSSVDKESSCNAEDPIWSRLRKTLCSRDRLPTPVFLPGKSLWTKEPGGLQSMGSQRVRHDGETKHNTAERHLRSPVWCYLMVKLRLGIWSKKLRAISET